MSFVGIVFNTDEISYCLSSFTCVHIEDGEAHGGAKVSNQGQNHNWPVGGIVIPLNEKGYKEHDPSCGRTQGVRILSANFVSQHHSQSFCGEVKDGSDDEVEEKSAGEVLSGESEAVHDEGGGKPVEIHDQDLNAES